MDRKQLKATEVSVLKEQQATVNKLIGARFGDRAQYLPIEKGTNKFRLYPAHPKTSSFIYARTLHWLPSEMKVERSGREITEIKNKPIFNSIAHGGTKKDIVDEYIKFTKKELEEEIQDEGQLRERLSPMTHWKTGILAKTTWVCYADKIASGEKEFGFLDISSSVKDKLNDLAITEDGDEPISVDPFTDPDDGKAIIITYNPNAKTPGGADDYKNYYKVTLEWKGNYALTDEQLEKWLKLESLESLYKNTYKRSDFENALRGLQLFDEKHKYGTFDHDAWILIVSEIDAYYPEEEVEKDGEVWQEEDKEVTKTEVVEEEASQPKASTMGDEKIPKAVIKDEFDTMDRTELKAFIKQHNLPILVTVKHSDDEIRDAMREEVTALPMGSLKEEPAAPKKEEEEEPPLVKKARDKAAENKGLDETPESDSDGRVHDKIEAMRAKMKSSKKQ